MLKKIQLLKYEKKLSKFEIECGKGFYVRSLARDLSLSLGTYGHISTLKRTKVIREDISIQSKLM